ncbi:hypothetical protein [Serratia proteamaculans]
MPDVSLLLPPEEPLGGYPVHSTGTLTVCTKVTIFTAFPLPYTAENAVVKGEGHAVKSALRRPLPALFFTQVSICQPVGDTENISTEIGVTDDARGRETQGVPFFVLILFSLTSLIMSFMFIQTQPLFATALPRYFPATGGRTRTYVLH